MVNGKTAFIYGLSAFNPKLTGNKKISHNYFKVPTKLITASLPIPSHIVPNQSTNISWQDYHKIAYDKVPHYMIGLFSKITSNQQLTPREYRLVTKLAEHWSNTGLLKQLYIQGSQDEKSSIEKFFKRSRFPMKNMKPFHFTQVRGKNCTYYYPIDVITQYSVFIGKLMRLSNAHTFNKSQYQMLKSFIPKEIGKEIRHFYSSLSPA